VTKLFRMLASSALLLFLIVVAERAFAQDDTWKSRNDRGNRYEGLIGINTGNPDLELLSFIASLEPYTEDVDMKVKFFLPNPSAVSIVAKEQEVFKQYYMEAKPNAWQGGKWNEFSPWPAHFLLQEKIPASNLGILVGLKKDGEITQYLPVIVYHSRVPDSIGTYTLYLRPRETLSSVTYTIYQATGNQVLRKLELKGKKAAGFPFPVELDMQGIPDGPLKVIISRKIKDRTEPPVLYEYRFYHKSKIA
jgi:hypothetical protein